MNRLRTLLALPTLLLAAAVFPSAAAAHGPVSPVASSYLARIGHLPTGVEAKIVDGDQRMWLSVAPGENLIVLDYRGAPYLRFSRSGVEVNQNSAMFYLNLTPVPETPPSDLTATTPPSWQHLTGAHDYSWHDGRLHALATVALVPGASFAGFWTIPLMVDGRLSAVSGGLWHADAPSIVWFWPIIVVLLCVLAARRVRRADLNVRVARLLAIVALVAIGVASAGRQLHGRPAVSGFALAELAVILALVALGLFWVLSRRPGYLSLFVIAFIAVWQGVVLIPTLLHGFVLMALPAFWGRAATDLCLGCGGGVLLLAFALAERREPEPAAPQSDPNAHAASV